MESLITTEFNNISDTVIDVQNIVDRFISDYPNSTYKIKNDKYDFSIYFNNVDWVNIEDVDTFLCEEICHEYEMNCFISNNENKKVYYHDEEDYWLDDIV